MIEPIVAPHQPVRVSVIVDQQTMVGMYSVLAFLQGIQQTSNKPIAGLDETLTHFRTLVNAITEQAKLMAALKARAQAQSEAQPEAGSETQPEGDSDA